MTWRGQVAHVMAKDLRQQAWLGAIFLAAVAGSTVLAAGWVVSPKARPFPFYLTNLLPVLPTLTTVLVALVIQADSPTRSDAFWATRPLAPSAVLAAKLLTFGVLLWGVPMIGQLVALRTLGVPWHKVDGLLIASGALQAGLVGACALVAALTPDLRTYVVGLIGAALAWSLLDVFPGFGLTPFVMVGIVGSGSILRAAVWLTVGLVGLAYLYRARSVRRALGVAALASLAGIVLVRAAPGRRVHDGDELAPIATTVDGGPVVAEVVGVQPLNGAGDDTWWNLHVRLALPEQPDGYVFEFLQARAVVTLADGSSFRPSGAQIVLPLTQPGAIADGYEWIGEEDSRDQYRQRGGIASFTLRQDEAEALLEGGATMTVTGLVEVAAPRLVGALPLEEHARLRDRDATYRVKSVRSLGEILQIALEKESVDGFRAFRTYDEPSGALVNRSRGEGIRLNTGGRGNAYRPLVLSGAQVASTAYDMVAEARRVARAIPTGEAEWLADARLEIQEWDVVGRYPVEVTLTEVVPNETPHPLRLGGVASR